MRCRRLAPLAALAAVLAAGCERREEYPLSPQSRGERLQLFANVEKLAVAPVRDAAGAPWPKDFGAEQFGTLFADELARRARFMVIYPREVAAAVEAANRAARERSQAEKRPPAEDELIDPARSELDAVAAGRAAGADAVLVATINDFEVYPPKRLALDVRVYLCAAPASRDALEVIAMSDAGVPLEITGPLRDRFIWQRQKHYDSRRKNTQTGLDWYARHHENATGFGEEIFYYSTERFLGFVASDLTDALRSDANWYRRNWPRDERVGPFVAPRPNAAGGGADSGFDPTQSEHGLRR